MTTPLTPEELLDIDEPCRTLVLAMNKVPGIETVESCCGHGERTFRIWFITETLEALPNLLYWFDGCHSGVYGWQCIVRTDCAKSPVVFRVESEAMGQAAYDEANQIAEYLAVEDPDYKEQHDHAE